MQRKEPSTGKLYKLGKGFRGRTWNKRFFVVSGQTLAYYSKEEAYEKQERPHKVVDLSGCRVEDTGMERFGGKARRGRGAHATGRPLRPPRPTPALCARQRGRA
jgi:hypothetical protein